MLQLKIPQPCHENWNEMSIAEQGRFCDACQKVVIDFTQMSDDEVKNYLLNNRHQKTCGRFYSRQLNQPFENRTISLNQSWFQQLPSSRKVFYAVALFFVLGIQSCTWETKGEASEFQHKEPAITYTTTMGVAAPAYRSTPGQDTTMKRQPSTPPKAKLILNPTPVLKGDVQITEPDTVAPMILGGISAPEQPPYTDTTQQGK